MNKGKYINYDTGNIWFGKNRSARSVPLYMVGNGSSESNHEKKSVYDGFEYNGMRRCNVFNVFDGYDEGECGISKKLQKKINNMKRKEKNSVVSSYYNKHVNFVKGATVLKRYDTRYFYNKNELINKEKAFVSGDICGENENKVIYKTRWFYNKSFNKQVDRVKLFKCNDKRCKVCICAEMEGGCETSNVNCLKLCKVYNCVYRLRCNVCNKSYIGETSTPFNIRFNNHKSDIRNFKIKNADQEIEIAHFADHGIENIRISILKVVPNEVERRICERNMMIKYGSVYPYGLNVKFNGSNVVLNFNSRDIDDSIYEKIKHDKSDNLNKSKCQGCNYKCIKLKMSTCEDVMRELKNCCVCNSKNIIKGIIFNTKKKLIPDLLNSLSSIKCTDYAHMGLDLLRYRIKNQNLQGYCRLKQSISETNYKIYFVIDYLGNCFRGVNFNMLINKYNELIPIPNLKIVKAFKYDKTLGRTIFNYNGFAKNLKNSANDSKCICSDPDYISYINKDHGHVVTGNLEIVKNKDLREYMELGTKYRIKRIMTKGTAVMRFERNIEVFIQKMISRYNLPYIAFEEWKYNILKEFKKVFVRDHEGIPHSKYNNIVDSIRDLQDKFVITYVDKANTSFAIICKQVYGELLRESYCDINRFELSSNISIIEKRIKAFYLKLRIRQKSKGFPYLILIPKFHKNPVKFRVVTCGFGSYIESANKKLLKILKEVFGFVQSEESTIIIKNSYDLLHSLKNCKNIKGLYTFDFEDLYSSIDLMDLKDKIIDFFSKYNNNVEDRIMFGNLFHFVIQENYVYEGDNVYKQIRGIPMGGSCSSILADIYLHIYEKNSSLDSNIVCYRYIDDILIVKLNNDNTTFNFDYYPDSLKLKPASIDNRSVNYLDVNLRIEMDNLITKIYDKRNEFDFDTIKLIHFESNVDFTVKRNVFRNGLIRISRLCTRESDVFGEIVNWCRQGAKQGYPRNFILRNLDDFTCNSSFRIELLEYWKRKGGMN